MPGSPEGKSRSLVLIVDRAPMADETDRYRTWLVAGGAAQRTVGLRMRRWVIVAVGLGLVLAGCGGGDDDQASEPEPVQTTASPTPSPTPSLKAPATLLSQAKEAVDDALDGSNRKVKPRFTVRINETREIVVKWAINENISNGLTRKGARIDTVDMLKEIKKQVLLPYKAVVFDGTYSLKDQYGEVSEDRVFLGTYVRTVVLRIQYGNIDHDRIWDLADPVYIHPAFR